MMAQKLEVASDGKRIYDIVIDDSFSGLAGELSGLGLGRKKLCIVTDSGVADYYLEKVKGLLADSCVRLEAFVFPEGERSKNLDTVARLYRFLIDTRFDRKDMLLALGGGVTGDLTGFAAATYLRGIDFVQVPTSLLAQVDSSIGGKTGVDLEAWKNMVGAFYMPRLVYTNIRTLKTLPDRQFRSGLGEVIKHGLIRDGRYFDWIRDHKEQILARDPHILADLVEGSCRIKRDVVEEDPRELGIRALLNYGHTLGHAIEKLTDFTLTHGECVAIGSLLAAGLSRDRGWLSREEYQEIRGLYEYFRFPMNFGHLAAEDIVEATKHDKKMEGGSLKFILLKRPGEAVICTDVSDRDLIRVLEAEI